MVAVENMEIFIGFHGKGPYRRLYRYRYKNCNLFINMVVKVVLLVD